MGTAPLTARVFRFGAFAVDARTGELTNAGRRTPLRDQPLQLLLALLERPGELVTREELTRRLWPADTFVDFDRGLNKAINHLREALSDSADHPQFIETLPRKGYRFIAPVTPDAADLGPVVDGAPPARSKYTSQGWQRAIEHFPARSSATRHSRRPIPVSRTPTWSRAPTMRFRPTRR
jgi:DNA-binding winged helix-turn-helix (wHTH) protein